MFSLLPSSLVQHIHFLNESISYMRCNAVCCILGTQNLFSWIYTWNMQQKSNFVIFPFEIDEVLPWQQGLKWQQWGGGAFLQQL